MEIWLEQLFFGRGPQGYAVLGSTPGGEPFRAAVESLCEAVGGPSGRSSFSPFLVSMPCNGRVVMVKASRGEPDSGGRETVFFHALVGSSSELASAHLDAFALDARGLFTDKLPPRFERMAVASGEGPAAPLRQRFAVRYPAAVLSRSPDGDLVRGMLGSAVLGRKWASFAFHPMSGFDLYVLDARAARPTDVACYDSDGTPLSEPKATVDRGPVEKVSAANPEKGNSMLKFSIVLNVALIALGAYLFTHRPPTEAKPDPASVKQIEELSRKNEQLAAEKAKFQADVEKRLQDELAQQEKKVIEKLKKKFEEMGGKKQKELNKDMFGAEDRAAFNPYIQFVNQEILEPSTVK